MFSPTPSVDGYGDRQDIADERDFSNRAKIAENKRAMLDKTELAVDRAREWGTADNATPMTQIILEMLKNECYEKLLLKSQIIRDAESINESLVEACIQLGLSDEDFCASYQDKGNQISLRLI